MARKSGKYATFIIASHDSGRSETSHSLCFNILTLRERNLQWNTNGRSRARAGYFVRAVLEPRAERSGGSYSRTGQEGPGHSPPVFEIPRRLTSRNLRRNPRSHCSNRLLRFADPFPHPPPAIIRQAARLAIIHQAVQHGRHRRQRILMPRQNRRSLPLQLCAYLACVQRTPHLHQHSAARFRESGLASVRFAVDQFQQVLAQRLLADQVCQSNNRLLDRANALHDLGPLQQQLPQLVVRRLYYMMHVRLGVHLMQAITLHFHTPLRQETDDHVPSTHSGTRKDRPKFPINVPKNWSPPSHRHRFMDWTHWKEKGKQTLSTGSAWQTYRRSGQSARSDRHARMINCSWKRRGPG